MNEYALRRPLKTRQPIKQLQGFGFLFAGGFYKAAAAAGACSLTRSPCSPATEAGPSHLGWQPVEKVAAEVTRRTRFAVFRGVPPPHVDGYGAAGSFSTDCAHRAKNFLPPAVIRARPFLHFRVTAEMPPACAGTLAMARVICLQKKFPCDCKPPAPPGKTAEATDRKETNEHRPTSHSL